MSIFSLHTVFALREPCRVAPVPRLALLALRAQALGRLLRAAVAPHALQRVSEQTRLRVAHYPDRRWRALPQRRTRRGRKGIEAGCLRGEVAGGRRDGRRLL